MAWGPRPRTLDQLATSRRALAVTLSQDTLRRLDENWPGCVTLRGCHFDACFFNVNES